MEVQDQEEAREAAWQAYQADSAALSYVLNGKEASNVLVSREVAAAGTVRDVYQAICGHTWNLDKAVSQLPPAPEDDDLIPEPYCLQAVQRPPKRPARPGLSRFKLLTKTGGYDDQASPRSGRGTSRGRPRSGRARSNSAQGVPVELTPKSRWLIPANGIVELMVQFQSDTVGRFSESVAFEVVSGERAACTVSLTGTCDYPRISSDPRNVFFKTSKARPSTPHVDHQFITATGIFEFGPLLAGKDPGQVLEGKHPDNIAKLRLTNSGLFDLHADLWLKSTVPEPGEVAAAPVTPVKGGGRGKVAAPAAQPPPKPAVPPFALGKSAVDLKVDETIELDVFAVPPEEGCFQDVIMCRIKDNPTLLQFPISLVGAKPAATLAIDGQQPQALVPPARLQSPRKEPPPPAPAHKGKGAAAAQPVRPPTANMLVVAFERLLLEKKDFKFVTLANTSVLPFKWRITGMEHLAKEFKVFPASGELSARSEVRLMVEFSALERRELNETLKLEVLDVQELQGVAVALPVSVRGEAYSVNVDIRFPNPTLTGLDYGTLRVSDSPSQPIIMKNTGKYAVAYKLEVKTPLAAELLTVTPEEGGIDPGKEVTVMVAFNKNRKLAREVTLPGHNDITLTISEPLNNSKTHVLPVKVSARALFNRCSLTPAKGINFGPLQYSSSSKPRTFEITNLGEFPLNFRLQPVAEEALTTSASTHRAITPSSAAKRGAAKKGAMADKKGSSSAAPPLPVLNLGPFTLEPASGEVPPGGRVEVSVVFKADASAVAAREKLNVIIPDRDPLDQPAGIPFELSGESCIPGIDTENLVAIFEEHRISSTLDPFNPVRNELGLKERVFNFGAVIANLQEPPPARPPSGSARPGSARPKSPAKPIPEAPQTPRPPPPQTGSKANLKFVNPGKIACVVNFAIKPRGSLLAGQAFPMVVDPPQIVIPPHEYRYTTLYFAPNAIQQYSATFEAAVVAGSDPATRSFTCELRGEGTLPTLSIQEPSAMDSSGRPLLKFPRLLRGRSATLPLVLRNQGILPVDARLELGSHDCFKMHGGGVHSLHLDPREGASFTVAYTPNKPGAFTHIGSLKVKNNPFESFSLMLQGDCYQEDVTLEDLPGDACDELRLPDAAVGEPVRAMFVLQNHTDSKHFKFKMPDHALVKFTPMLGHLHAGSRCTVTATFCADKPVRLVGVDMKLGMQQITYKGGPPVDWDDSMTSAGGTIAAEPSKTDTQPQTAVSRGKDGGKTAAAKQSLEQEVSSGRLGAVREPAHDVVPKSHKDLSFKVHAVADNAKYDCEAGPIAFRPTMMFQTRSYSFTLANKGLGRLPFKWSILMPNGEVDMDSMYSISPEAGEVEPGASVSITVRLSPQEVEDCSRVMVASIPHLDAACQPLRRVLTGKVLRPWCHFELPESDYISGGRRAADMPGPSGALGPLDPATRVVELQSLGVKVKTSLQFRVLNPTGASYEFFWEPAGPQPAAALGKRAAAFICATKSGTITGGRRYDMYFEFTPQDDNITESFWTFSIPAHNICVPFLLVGLVAEPRVAFELPAINFGQVLLGVRAKQVIRLVNSEAQPFSYALDLASYDATAELVAHTGKMPVLEIDPVQGVVPPKGSVELTATFAPDFEREINYTVVCAVKRKPTRLTLNVKATAYAIHDSLQLEEGSGQVVQLAPSQPNSLDLGSVIVNDRCIKALALVNSGDVNYDFVWDLGKHPRLSITPEAGTVPRGGRTTCELTYQPRSVEKLAGHLVKCQIVNSHTYSLALHGGGYKPNLALSTYSHDFGACLVWKPGMPVVTYALHVTNNDRQPVSFDPHYNGADHVQVSCATTLLQPGQSSDIMVTFRPPAPLAYEEVLLVEVNGLYTIPVMLKGEGCPLVLELANPSQKKVNFGSVMVKQSATRVVALVNRSRAPITVSLKPSREVLSNCHIEAMPCAPTTVAPRQHTEVSLFFRPPGRTRPFNEQITLDVCGLRMQLFSITGACLGTELQLASDSIPFGAVVLGSRTVKRVQLANSGDVGTRFVWDTRDMEPHFSISPTEGFLAPHQDVKLDVAFHPTSVDPDIRVQGIRCKVEGAADLQMTLTGACVKAAAQPDSVAFKCNVRGSAAKTIMLHNSSSTSWQLHPVVQNDFWSGPEYLAVPAGGKAEYVLTYKPLCMTDKDKPHHGSVFFPIPDGTGLLYSLVGQAEAPVSEGTIERTAPAKETIAEVLRVRNWLGTPQRFRLAIDRKQAAVATTITGPDYVDVPAHGFKDVRISFYSYTTGLTLANVVFKNDQSGEYTFYELKVTASAALLRGTYSLSCPVRTQVVQRISITNPLQQEVRLKSTTTDKQVVVPSEVLLKAGVTTDMEVRYRPLVVRNSEALLTLESAELGTFEYKLALQGTSTNPERQLIFSVPLGSSDSQVLRFTNYLPEKVEYRCSLQSASASGFEVAATVVAPPAGPEGVEVEVEVHFEPSVVGEQLRDTLVVSSPVAGEYVCPLLGRCQPPKPLGPILLNKNSGSVTFKNVFSQEAEFLCAVDNPSFTVKPLERIGAKKSVGLAVAFRGAGAGIAGAGGGVDKTVDPSLRNTGKLTVSCPKLTNAVWVFYLQA